MPKVSSFPFAVLQIIRRLLQFGIPGLDHPHVEPYFFGLLQRMPTVLATLTTFATSPGMGGVGGEGAGETEGVMEELEELAERMAGTAVDAQKDHPIGFRRWSGLGLGGRVRVRVGARLGCRLGGRVRLGSGLGWG